MRYMAEIEPDSCLVNELGLSEPDARQRLVMEEGIVFAVSTAITLA